MITDKWWFGIAIGFPVWLISFAASANELPGDEGLRLLESVDGVVHKIEMHLTHTEKSLETGWVEMRQCHCDMAPTGRSSIVFSPARARRMELLHARGVGKYWIGEDGVSVEMEDVSKENEICFEGELRKVYLGGGQYHQNSGPYFLRFLDGYFPLKLDLMVDTDRSGMKVSAVEPSSVPYKIDRNGLHIDLLFEGRLTLVFSFEEQ
ncbi:MAG: hypothetical protein HOG80_00050 [Candidatus Marinimicrobia bacterium]|nr:hypothetical protein [Candidatus Neomarinimicrobiota bacterium]